MSSQSLFLCYVDESGDEGLDFTRGASPWFFVSGVIVHTDDEVKVRAVVDEAIRTIWVSRHQTPPSLLHWRDLDHNKKIVVAQLLAAQPFCQVSVGIWKRGISQTSRLTQSDFLYRYAVRFLLERVTWYVDDQGGRVKLAFSNRSRLDPTRLRDYVIRIMGTPGAQVRPVFDPNDILVRNASQLKMLQVADACTSAVANAFNPDHYGNTRPYYLEKIRHRLYCRAGHLLNYGLKLLPRGYSADEYPFLSTLVR